MVLPAPPVPVRRLAGHIRSHPPCTHSARPPAMDPNRSREIRCLPNITVVLAPGVPQQPTRPRPCRPFSHQSAPVIVTGGGEQKSRPSRQVMPLRTSSFEGRHPLGRKMLGPPGGSPLENTESRVAQRRRVKGLLRSRVPDSEPHPFILPTRCLEEDPGDGRRPDRMRRRIWRPGNSAGGSSDMLPGAVVLTR